MGILDFIDALNFLDRGEGLLARLRYRDAGYTFHLDRSKMTGAQAEALLKKYGVAVFGRRITDREVIFSVKRRQARWAEHVLTRAGAPIVSGEVDASNRGAYQRHKGTLPKPWKKDGRR